MEATQDYRPDATAEASLRMQPLFSYRSFGDDARAALREQFDAAVPFPHLVIDDFVNLEPELVTGQFPTGEWAHWQTFRDAYQHQKRTCADIERLPKLFQDMIFELSSPSFLRFLESVTGIPALIPDPYLKGGGLHSSGPGGVLAPHADFHSYGDLALYRQINVLVYFNLDWSPEDGGSLELFRKGERSPAASVVPEFGRMVLFRTDDRSIHGFTKPVAPGRSRNSLALYYYTAEDTGRFAGDGATYWQEHGAHRGVGRAQLLAYKILQHGAWTLSKYAHRLNPNFKPTSTSEAKR